MSDDRTLNRKAEFDEHVWDHATDAFQTAFDARRPLSDDEMATAIRVVESILEGNSDEDIAGEMRELCRDPSQIHVLMQIVGLTRNKIITDLRVPATSRELRLPSKPEGLPSASQEVWDLAAQYLIEKLRSIALPLTGMSTEDLEASVESLNQATWPGWIRQERAKRQGHEAEYRLATVLAGLKLPFEPREKADNPLCRDAQIHGVSFDLVVPSTAECLLCFKSTVHTSNIGQYGESKDALEVLEAREMLAKNYPADSTPLLMALVDGIGFRSNKSGLVGVLGNVDEFCQFASLWKAAVVAAAVLDQKVLIAFDDSGHERNHRSFVARHENAIEIVEPDGFDEESSRKPVRAGEASVQQVDD